MDYATLDAMLAGRSRDRKKVDNNTYAERRGDDIAVRLHATDVLTFSPEGYVTYNTGGWLTVTTKDRLNKFGADGWMVSSVKGRWFLSGWGISVPFSDGVIVDADNRVSTNPVDTASEDETNRETNRQIDAYLKGLTPEVWEKVLTDAQENGLAGDCWFCLMFDRAEPAPETGSWNDRALSPAQDSGDTAHLRSHLDERYYFASLALNALTSAGYRHPGAVIFHLDIVKRAVRRYLRKRLTIGAVAVR